MGPRTAPLSTQSPSPRPPGEAPSSGSPPTIAQMSAGSLRHEALGGAHNSPAPSRVTPSWSVGHQRPGFQMGHAADMRGTWGRHAQGPRELEPHSPTPAPATSRPARVPATLPLPLCSQPQAQGCPSSRVDAGDITQHAHLLFPGCESRATGLGQAGSVGLWASLKAHHWRPCPRSVGWHLV